MEKVVQPSRTPLWTALIAGTFALLGAIVGSYTTSYLGFQNQLRLATSQKREQAYAALAGHRFMLTQMYTSAMQAQIDFEFHHRRLELERRPALSSHLQETQRLVGRRDDLALEFGRANQRLFETVGLIRAINTVVPSMNSSCISWIAFEQVAPGKNAEMRRRNPIRKFIDTMAAHTVRLIPPLE